MLAPSAAQIACMPRVVPGVHTPSAYRFRPSSSAPPSLRMIRRLFERADISGDAALTAKEFHFSTVLGEADGESSMFRNRALASLGDPLRDGCGGVQFAPCSCPMLAPRVVGAMSVQSELHDRMRTNTLGVSGGVQNVVGREVAC